MALMPLPPPARPRRRRPLRLTRGLMALIAALATAALCLAGTVPAQAAAAPVVKNGVPQVTGVVTPHRADVSANADIGVGLNTITILFTPDEQKALLQGGTAAGALLGAQACIGLGYGDVVCVLIGAIVAGIIIAFIQDKVSPKCSLEVTMDWGFNIIGFRYPNCPTGP